MRYLENQASHTYGGNSMAQTQQVTEIAVNLDDVSPEVVAAACEALFQAGALDVWTQPIGMKKQRAGVMLVVLCESSQGEALARMMIEQTGSFGVRFRTWERLVLDREFVQLSVHEGPFTAKVGAMDGKVVSIKPEFDDIQTLACENGVSVRALMDKARAACRAWLEQQTANS